MLSILLFIFAIGAAIASVDTTCGLNVLGSLDSTKVSKFRYALVYIASCMLGGAVTGLAIGLFNFLLKFTPVGLYQNYIIITLFAVFLVLELIHRTGILPSGNFIVPSEWIKHAGYRSAALWGHILGLGFITLQVGVLFHAYILVSLFASPWWLSLLAGITFGFVRGMVFSLPLIRSIVYRMLEKRVRSITLLTAVRQAVSMLLIIGSIIWIISY
ncbi:hypothetical protein C7121_19505 [Paenibacillus glucanolyticus]|uniref:hypothetical protein n=1 Tax=Paenibacillus TaxID=44249 RepID=UPI0003E24EEF|nr:MULTISPECIES: hypothetical protein [Paenibacillus]ANA82762.1 hypothetical protein A3958_23530 [Paenibacillus glucanolyticus]AVV58156.1 hypothetical protein C7121_19505 [Paenibacillus glucanolyticus]ETT42908.1 hypothetical protein C169_03322 [Paenibacillus sp. FSL R5-808]MPY17771.1 hypothetical protein [Paenibacillus glucanolyticus]